MGNFIQIRCPGAASAQLMLKDLSGRLLRSWDVSDQQQLDVSELPVGTYVYSLSNRERCCTGICIKL
jgi:hypothetical protein